MRKTFITFSSIFLVLSLFRLVDDLDLSFINLVSPALLGLAVYGAIKDKPKFVLSLGVLGILNFLTTFNISSSFTSIAGNLFGSMILVTISIAYFRGLSTKLKSKIDSSPKNKTNTADDSSKTKDKFEISGNKFCRNFPSYDERIVEINVESGEIRLNVCQGVHISVFEYKIENANVFVRLLKSSTTVGLRQRLVEVEDRVVLSKNCLDYYKGSYPNGMSFEEYIKHLARKLEWHPCDELIWKYFTLSKHPEKIKLSELITLIRADIESLNLKSHLFSEKLVKHGFSQEISAEGYVSYYLPIGATEEEKKLMSLTYDSAAAEFKLSERDIFHQLNIVDELSVLLDSLKRDQRIKS